MTLGESRWLTKIFSQLSRLLPRSSHGVKKVADRDGMLMACDGADGSGGATAARRAFFPVALGGGGGKDEGGADGGSTK